MATEWKMPRPKQGDVVLYSNDHSNFTSPCIAWVLKEPGDTTIQVLTFTEQQGFVVRPSVHHRDDPALREDNGWQGLGVWDLTEAAKEALGSKKSTDNPVISRRAEMSRGREQTAAQ